MKRLVLLFTSLSILFSCSSIFALQQSLEVTPCDFNEGMSIGLSPPDFFNIYHRTGQEPILAATTPNFQSGFEAELGFWRARPNDGELAYTILDPTPILIPGTTQLLINSTNSRLLELDPSHPLSFFGTARYIFGNTHRDLKLSFYQVDEQIKDHVEAPSGGTLWPILSATPVRFFDALGGVYQTATEVNAKVNYKFNIGSLDLGHHIYSLRPVDFRIFAGVGAANITRNMNVTYHNVGGRLIDPFPFPPGRVVVTQDTDFKGIGPRIGASGTVEFGSGFGFVAQIADEVLIGNENSKYVDQVFQANDTILDATAINPGNQYRVVPVLDGKLALRYNYCFSPSFKVGLEGGYQIFHFFNPFTTFRYAADPAGLGFGGATHTKIIHDANLEGAYLAINFSGFSSCGEVCPPFPVTIPNLPGGLEIGFGIDYLKPFTGQNDYAILDASPVRGPTPGGPIHPSTNSSLKEVTPDYDPGYHAHIGYAFAFSPYDVTFDFLYVNATNTAHLQAPVGGGIWPITSIIANEFDQFLAPSLASTAVAKVSAYERVYNLVLGKHIFADSLRLRLFGGVEAAEVENNLTSTYNITSLTATTPEFTIFNPTETVTQKSSYSGIGPRIGFDANYYIAPYLALVSHFGSAFLYGKFNSSITDQGFVLVTTIPGEPITTFAPTAGTSSSETSHIVPTLDANIGLAFDICLFATSHATLEIGYQFNHYFNGTESFRHANPISGTFVRQVDDITFEGPYIDLTFYGLTFCPPVCELPPPSVVTVPEFFGNIELGIKYLYFNPHAGNFTYAIDDPTPVAFPPEFTTLRLYPVEAFVSTNSRTEGIDPAFESGYGVHLGYQIPCTANDISANYEYFSSKDADSIQAVPGGFLWTQLLFVVEPYLRGVPVGVETPSFPVVAREASESVAFRYNYANLEFARHHNLRCFDLRLAAGLGYTNLTENLHAVYLDGLTQTFTDDAATFIPRTDVFIDTIFTGLGPRFAATAKYVSPYIVGFSGTAATDLLIGKLRSRYVAATSDGVATTLNPDGHVYVVPKLSLDLAVTFDYTIACYHKVSLDIGYEVNHFFNATNSYQYTSGMIPSHVKGERDVSFDGPYAKFQIAI